MNIGSSIQYMNGVWKFVLDNPYVSVFIITTLSSALYKLFRALTNKIKERNKLINSDRLSPVVSPEKKKKINQPLVVVKNRLDYSQDRRKAECTASSVDLIHDVPIDSIYADLESYLSNARWKEADEETCRILSEQASEQKGQNLTPDEISRLPCECLKSIDDLWTKYSGGKFGFSVQVKMYITDCGGVPDGLYQQNAWNRLCFMTGWQVDGEYVSAQFDLSSPVGHLPYCGFPRLFQNQFPIIMYVSAPTVSTFYSAFSSLASRARDCGL